MRLFLLSFFSLITFSFLLRHPVFSDPDVFYHVKMALLLREGFWPDVFPWLPWTVLREGFADQHLLYHLILIPFGTFFPPFLGVKIATVLLASAAVVSFFFLARALFPRFAFLAALSLLVTSPFLFRMSLGKAQPVALLLLFLFLFALVRRRPIALFVLSFLAVWTHGSWPLFLIFAAIFYFFQEVRNGYWSRPRVLFIASIAGALAGIIIHPSFPNTFTFPWYQTVRIAVFGLGIEGAGMEWYPPDLSDIVATLPLQVLFLLLSFLFFLIALERRRLQSHSFSFFLFGIIGTVLFLRSSRHVEFAVPLVTLAFFSLLHDMCGEQSCLQALQRLFRATFSSRTFRSVVYAFCFLALGTMAFRGVHEANWTLARGRPITHLSAVSAWAREHIPKGEMIVASDWDIFPELFFFNDSHTYVAGLDPRFFRFGDQRRYDVWVRLLEKEGGAMGTIMQDDLSSRYVLIAHEHKELLERAQHDRSLRAVYHDDEASVFEAL